MKLISLSFLFLVVLSFERLAQNLVPNGSFEEHQPCEDDNGFGSKFLAKDWIVCGPSTAYYTSHCEGRLRTTPQYSPTGFQYPYTGKSYVHIDLYNSTAGFRDFIQVKLNEPLIKGEVYTIRFYLSLIDECAGAVKKIGAHFTTTELTYEELFALRASSVEYNSPDYLSDKEAWMPVTMSYTAKGGEQYLSIGRFTPNFETDPSDIKELYKTERDDFWAYYILDDVSVTSATNNADALSKETFEKGKSITLNNIFFETDKAVLLTASTTELDKLTGIMQNNPSLIIVIRGYTDNTGTEEHNQQLSLERANAVMNYLLKKGIGANRLSTWGFGSTRPLASNITEEGRAVNRRVEILVK